MFYILKSEYLLYTNYCMGAPLNAETVGGPGKNTVLPPPLSGPASTAKRHSPLISLAAKDTQLSADQVMVHY